MQIFFLKNTKWFLNINCVLETNIFILFQGCMFLVYQLVARTNIR